MSLTLQLLVLVLAFRLLLVAVPATTPALEIEVISSVAGTSQVFVASPGESFTEEHSVTADVHVGRNLLRFPLSAVLGSSGEKVRWDPADVPVEVEVRSLTLTGLLSTSPIPVSEILPERDILDFNVSAGGVRIETGSDDGQTVIGVNPSDFVRDQEWLLISLCVTLAALVLAAVVGVMRHSGRISSWRGDCLAVVFDPRSNALNSIRLILAVLVIASHTDAVAGWPPRHSLGFLGEGLVVDCFFGLSGFLMARTWSRRPALGRYLWHRTTRLVPAFWCTLVVVAFVLAPLSLAMRGGQPTQLLQPSDGPVAYVVRNATLWLVQFGVAGTPTGVPLSDVWNLSIWTMGWTVVCDLVLVCLGLIGAISRRRWIVAVSTLAVWGTYCLIVLGSEGVGRETALVPLRFLLLFLLGIIAQQWGGCIPLSWPLAVLAGLVVIVSELRLQSDYRIIGAVPLVYLILYLASRLPLRMGSRHDLSYGLFLFGFPVQQLLVMLGLTAAGWWVFTGVSALLTLPFAAACWFMVERPAMRLREWTPDVLTRHPVTWPSWVPSVVAVTLLIGYLMIWWFAVRGPSI